MEPFEIESWDWLFWDTHTAMCDVVIIRRVLHGLNFIFGLFSVAILRRATTVLQRVSKGFWAVYALFILNISWRRRDRKSRV